MWNQLSEFAGNQCELGHLLWQRRYCGYSADGHHPWQCRRLRHCRPHCPYNYDIFRDIFALLAELSKMNNNSLRFGVILNMNGETCRFTFACIHSVSYLKGICKRINLQGRCRDEKRVGELWQSALFAMPVVGALIYKVEVNPFSQPRGAICCHEFFLDEKSSALSVLRSWHFVSTFSQKMHSGAKIIRLEPAKDDVRVEWHRCGVGDTGFVPSCRRLRLPVKRC